MGNNLMPLHYAILEHFANGKADCAEGVVKALEADYQGYKLLNRTDVEEALATAKENGLLDEVGCDLDDQGSLRILYQANDFGMEMMKKYLVR